MLAIQLLDEIDFAALPLVGVTVLRGDVQNRRFAVAEFRALIGRGHEAGAPLAIAAGRFLLIVGQHDVAGQVVAGSAQSVEHPRADAWSSHQNAARVHLTDTAHVRQTIGPARTNHGHVVHTTGDFGIPIADPNSRLPVLFEFPLAGHQRRKSRLAHGGQGARKAVGQRLASKFRQRRFGIEKVEMARPAVEKAPDDRLGFGRHWRRFCGQRISKRNRSLRGQLRRFGITSQQRPERQGAESAAGTSQEVAARLSSFEVRNSEFGVWSALIHVCVGRLCRTSSSIQK